MIRLRFPYRGYTVPGGPGGSVETIYRPTITVEVIGPKGGHFLDGRLDTGADETLLPWPLAARVGATIEPGALVPIETASGTVLEGMRGTVDLQVVAGDARIRWTAAVVFMPTNPPPLFGIGGFLRHFAATFHGARRWVELVPIAGIPRSRAGPRRRTR